jgi:hypothetical protein
MYLVTYSENSQSNGSGSWGNKTYTSETEKDKKTFVKDRTGRAQYANLRIWAPLGNENIDYKEKFEELYDFVLKGAGIRTLEKDKVMI